jgi:peptidoglycan/LPS O-acetylase OafA/YrhL
MKKKKGDYLMRFESIQLLRFLAAFMVVITHATFYVGTRIDHSFPLWNSGAQGVNLFFVISGFVMFLTSRPLIGRPHAFRHFMLSRLIRIAPLYWLLNILKIIQILTVPALAFANPTVSNVLFSMFFIPSRNADGAIETFYGVGWTLNFEMAFYLVVAVALVLRAPIISLVAMVILVGAALSIIRTDEWPAITYLFHPIILNFLWGMLIARWVLGGGSIRPGPAVAMIVAGLAIIFGQPELFILEIEYALVVVGCVALESQISSRLPRLVIFGGDASYSLYLVHPMVGALAAVILAKSDITEPYFALSVIIVMCLACSFLTYWYIEKPSTSYLRAHFLGSNSVKHSKSLVVVAKKESAR